MKIAFIVTNKSIYHYNKLDKINSFWFCFYMIFGKIKKANKSSIFSMNTKIFLINKNDNFNLSSTILLKCSKKFNWNKVYIL